MATKSKAQPIVVNLTDEQTAKLIQLKRAQYNITRDCTQRLQDLLAKQGEECSQYLTELLTKLTPDSTDAERDASESAFKRYRKRQQNIAERRMKEMELEVKRAESEFEDAVEAIVPAAPHGWDISFQLARKQVIAEPESDGDGLPDFIKQLLSK